MDPMPTLAPIAPGRVSPRLPVPASIDRPEYVDRPAPTPFSGSEVKDAETIEAWLLESGHLDRVRLLALPSLGMDRVVNLHGQIIDGIEAGDAEAAVAAMREHMSRTPKMAELVAQRYPDYVENGADLP